MKKKLPLKIVSKSKIPANHINLQHSFRVQHELVRVRVRSNRTNNKYTVDQVIKALTYYAMTSMNEVFIDTDCFQNEMQQSKI